MSPDHDSHLREQFAQLRREDSVGASELQRVLDHRVTSGRAPRAWQWRSFALAGALVAALVSGAIVARSSRPRPEVDLSATSWRGPTDFLLWLPGEQPLRTVPRLGERTLTWRVL